MRLSTLSIPSLLAFGIPSLAQNITILSPKSDAPLPGFTGAGPLNITVQIGRNETSADFSDVGIAIGFEICPDYINNNDFGPRCPTVYAASGIGQTVLVSTFEPQLHDPSLPPYQNFSITIDVPSQANGEGVHAVQLAVGHFYLTGANSTPVIDIAVANYLTSY